MSETSSKYSSIHKISAVDADAGQFRAELAPPYNIFNVPNGGYSLSMVATAAQQLPGLKHPDPITTSARYVNPLAAGEVDITFEVLAESRALTTLGFRVKQKGVLAVLGALTMSDFSKLPPFDTASDTVQLPPREVCTFARTPLTEDPGAMAPLQHVLSVALDEHPMPADLPDDTHGLAAPRHAGYMGVVGATLDTSALLFLGDALPPPIFKAAGRLGWVPTLEYTVRVFADVSELSPDEVGFVCWLDGVRNGLGLERGLITTTEGGVIAEFSQIFRVRSKEEGALARLAKVESLRARPVLV